MGATSNGHSVMVRTRQSLLSRTTPNHVGEQTIRNRRMPIDERFLPFRDLTAMALFDVALHRILPFNSRLQYSVVER